MFHINCDFCILLYMMYSSLPN